jgi:PBSX family phage terminase large subunit
VIIAPLSEKQRRSWQLADARQNLWEGSVRSGKTVASLHAWSEFVLTSPPGNLAMIGRTERTLKHNIIDVLVDMYGRREARLVAGSGEFWLHGRRVYTYGANDEAARTKIQGLTLMGAYCDETTNLPESFYKMLLNRLSLPGARLFATMNPDSPAHWMKTAYLDHARTWLTGDGQLKAQASDVDAARFSFRLYDNETLPEKFIADLEAENTGLWRRRYVLGEWVAAEGAVYDMWDDTRHVLAAEKLPPLARLLSVGIDYGTNHPTRGYLLGVSAEDRPRLVVADEWAPPKMTDAGYSADYRKWIAGRQPEWLCVDPAAASLKLQLFSDGHGNVMDANNAVLDGIRTVSSLLATDCLVVSDACRQLIAEVPGYSWDDKATLRGLDAPIKANDDCCDALRYAVASTRALWGNLVPLTMPIPEEAAA